CRLLWRKDGSRGLSLRLRHVKVETEIDETLLVPIDLAQIELGCDLPDLVADPMRDERSFGVIEHDALVAVEPAFVLIYVGDDCIEPERQDAVRKHTAFRVESFSLPGEDVHKLGDFIAEPRTRSYDRCAFRLAVGDVAGSVGLEQIVQLRLTH